MKVLIISPHPDDEAIGCGGVICKHRFQGSSVQTLFMTSGELGAPGYNAIDTAIIRQGEAERSAEMLDTSHPIFLGYPDGKLSDLEGVAVPTLVGLFRASYPDVIYTPNREDQHDDHRAATRILLNAVASIPDMHPEIYEYEVWTPLQNYDLIEDISEWIGKKMLAIREHYSQVTRVRFDEAALCLARYRGELHNRPHGPYAEVFRRIYV